MSNVYDDIVECLRRKGCAMSVARMVDEIKRPPQEIEASLGVLRRNGVVQILRPGEWTLAPERNSGAEPIPPEPPFAIARARPLLTTEAAARAVAEDRRAHEQAPRRPPPATTDDQEMTMAKGSKKICTKCKASKGATAFFKGDDVCRFCHGGKTAKARKAQGGVAQSRGNGHAGLFGPSLAQLRAAREDAAGRVSKIDAAIAALEALA